ncbi:hypothetical protein [Flexibacterium corallicola]|uniref:hypothetical protein n=1 Tax=Flexibacterium corallicola TaxID=3037259 RepID=UPI00286FAE7E|nr:hypothetical protein [Pseudovibrio sp. M1P-2-3]
MRVIATLLALVCLTGTAPAQVRTENATCARTLSEQPLRQTLIVIDGAMVAPDTDNGPSAKNQNWRRFLTSLLNPSGPNSSNSFSPNEPVTVAIASSDGASLSPIFQGCMPIVSAAEAEKLDSQTSSLDTFIGRDWRSRHKKQAETFLNSLVMASVEGINNVSIGGTEKVRFTESGLIESMQRNPMISLDKGIPRILILTDMDLYTFPNGDITTIRAAARSEGIRGGGNFLRAETHIFAQGLGQHDQLDAYLKPYFLSQQANLVSIGSFGAALPSNSQPTSVSVFQGVADFPQGTYPMRMRLAKDQSNSIVNSWVEVQSDQNRFVPFNGLLNCQTDTQCEYIGDRVFAQIWSDNPNPEPECLQWMAFAGMRELSFSIEGEQITGNVSDPACEIVGREEGISFKLTKVSNGLF